MYRLRFYLLYPANVIALSIALIGNIYAWVWPLLQLSPAPDEQVFLHYTILYGVDYTGTFTQLFAIPFTGLMIVLLNVILGWMLFHRDKLLAYLLVAMAALCQVFIAIVMTLLVFLNA